MGQSMKKVEEVLSWKTKSLKIPTSNFKTYWLLIHITFSSYQVTQGDFCLKVFCAVVDKLHYPVKILQSGCCKCFSLFKKNKNKMCDVK